MEQKNRWDDLKKAFTDLYTKTLITAKFKDKIKITIIQYNSNAYMCINAQPPNLDHIKKLDLLKGGTFFGAPIELAYTNIKENLDNFSNFFVYFMTDGDDSYPEREMNYFKNDSELTLRCIFNFVKYGNDQSFNKNNSLTLQKMATDLKGTITNALTYDEILNSMVEIIKSL